MADQVSHCMWPKDGSLQMNRAAEAVAFIVQADIVHFDADKEILEVENKIAALEAQSANVHDESKRAEGWAQRVPRAFRKNRVALKLALCSLGVARSDARRSSPTKKKTKSRIREVTRTLKKGPEVCRIRRLMSAGP